MSIKILKSINNLLLVLLLLILIFAIVVYLGILPKNFLFFHMEFFGRFYERALSYLLFGIPLIYFSRRYIKIKKNAELIILLVFLNFLLDGLGNFFGWDKIGNQYSSVWYDKSVHLTGGIIYTSVFYMILINYFSSQNNFLILLTAFGLSFALGTLFGVGEYLSDKYFKTYMVGGLEDSIGDNIFDFLGSITGSAILYLTLFSSQHHKT